MDRFGVIEAAGRVRDEQGGFFISQQRAALALVAQGGEQLRIELIARAGDGLHRLLRDGEKQQDCDHGQRADGPSQPEQAVARGLRAGLRRERRAVDGVQHGRGEDEVRIGFIAVHHGQRPAEGKLRRRGCDGQNEDVRVLRHIDAARPREGVQTHFGGQRRCGRGCSAAGSPNWLATESVTAMLPEAVAEALRLVTAKVTWLS